MSGCLSTDYSMTAMSPYLFRIGKTAYGSSQTGQTMPLVGALPHPRGVPPDRGRDLHSSSPGILTGILLVPYEEPYLNEIKPPPKFSIKKVTEKSGRELRSGMVNERRGFNTSLFFFQLPLLIKNCNSLIHHYPTRILLKKRLS